MEYDAIIIGAGMSGLSTGIRLQMFDKKTIILESHSIVGGLNSYYKRGERNFDVGLHAMTNFIEKGEKGKPLNKLLKQLRIPYNKLNLSPQNKSKIIIKDHTLEFTNNIQTLIKEIELKFPDELEGFNNLLEYLNNYNETDLYVKETMARPVVGEYIKDEQLIELIFMPLLIYGSATPNDMTFSQFAIMFRSIFLEGFARPFGGVRIILDQLTARYKDLEGEISFNTPVREIIIEDNKAIGVITKDGTKIFAKQIYSSAGHPETMGLISDQKVVRPEVGQMSFCECIFNFKDKPEIFEIDDTIVFYNNSNKYRYDKALDFYDRSSAVICMPNNFKKDDNAEGVIRLTFIANFELWNKLRINDRKEYLAKKEEMASDALKLFKELYPNFDSELLFYDTFTPTSVQRYTGHYSGTVYGAPNKLKDGKTNFDDLFIIGTDQGFLGIVGAMLSGISMANLHGLQNG